jgi:hypothetical protein
MGPGFVDTFLRDNKVLPPVFALLALVVFAWVVAGTFVGGSDGERVSNQANIAQSQNVPGADPIAPEAENRDVDSYAAYRNKDPFRQLLARAEGTSAQPSGETTEPPDEDTSGTSGAGGSGSTAGGASRAQDTDDDGLTDRREAALAQDPGNPDTDSDGTPDGADDADGDGQPDGRVSGAGGGSDASPDSSPNSSPDASPDANASSDAGSETDPGGNADASAPSSGDAGGGGRGSQDGGDGGPGRDNDLLDSGGGLYAP